MFFKAIGSCLLLAACGTLGWQQADRLRAKVILIREAKAFWEQFRTQLIHLRASPGDIIHTLAHMGAFEKNCLAAALERAFRNSADFGANLSQAMRECPELCGCGAGPIIMTLGDIIGSRDLESQLAALDSVLELLRELLKEAETDYGKRGGLYRRLGILSGLALVVIFL